MSDPGARDILVIGVTGSQGRAVARHLVAAGMRVRGLTRNPGSAHARALAASGVALHRGDLDDRSTVATAMRGVGGVYLVTEFFKNGIPGEIRQGTMVADALFARITGRRPFALPMPTFLFRRLVSEELVSMWTWLAEHFMDGDSAATARLVPNVKDAATWLQSRAEP